MLDHIHEETVIASGAYPHLNNDALKEEIRQMQSVRKFVTKRFFRSILVIIAICLILFALKFLFVWEGFLFWISALFGFLFVQAFIMLFSAIDSLHNYFYLDRLQQEACRRRIEYEA